jgi:hypothetical protein
MLSVSITKFGDSAHEVTAAPGCNAPVANGSLLVWGTVSPVTNGPHGECWVSVGGTDVPTGHVGFAVNPKTGGWSVVIGGLGPYVGGSVDVKASAASGAPDNGSTTLSVNLVNAT